MKRDLIIISTLGIASLSGLIPASLSLLGIALYSSGQAFLHEFRRRISIEEREGRLEPQGGNNEIDPLSALRFALSLICVSIALGLLYSNNPSYKFSLGLALTVSPVVFAGLALMAKNYLNQTLTKSYSDYKTRSPSLTRRVASSLTLHPSPSDAATKVPITAAAATRLTVR